MAKYRIGHIWSTEYFEHVETDLDPEELIKAVLNKEYDKIGETEDEGQDEGFLEQINLYEVYEDEDGMEDYEQIYFWKSGEGINKV